jgi:hypothetical protein
MDKRMILLSLLLGCLGGETVDVQDSTIDSTIDSPDVTVHLIEHIAQTPMPSGNRSSRGITSQVNDFTYLLEDNNRSLFTLSDVYVAPSGYFCLQGGTGDECTGGVPWISGRIEALNAVGSLCADDDNGRLFLVSQSGESVEFIDVNPAGSKPYTYNKRSGFLRVPSVLAANFKLSGPCHYDSEGNNLLLTSTTREKAVLLSVDTGTVVQEYDLAARPEELWYIDSTDRFLAQESASLALINREDLSVTTRVGWEQPLIDVAVDTKRGEALVVHGDGKLDRILLGEQIIKENIELEDPVSHVAMDQTTGLDWVLTTSTEGAQTLNLIEDKGLLDSTPVEDPVTDLFSTGTTGDLIVVSNPDESIMVDVYDVQSNPSDTLPPLYGMLVTTLEYPIDGSLVPCTGNDSENFDARAKALIGNAQLLADLNIPISVAVTDNFIMTAERCERLDLLDVLVDHGFEFGVLVYDRPCYECTSAPTEGENPDTCPTNSPFYCDPSRHDCCFPSDENYCDWGDYDCYLNYMNPKINYVEERLPGGAKFISGADRHEMWGWNWRRAYAEVDRANGSKGYDVTLFAQAWAYQELTLDDPRGKNPAPWLPRECAPAWAMASEGNWTDDSAFSDLLYLPGLSTSGIKLAEWQSTGLHVLDFLFSGVPVAYSMEDYDVLTGFIRRSLNHRAERGPNTFYFHFHDISSKNLADYNGNPTGAEEFIQAWVQDINSRYVDNGELIWTTPGAVRAEFPPRD